jgi:hypothetical protein
MKKAFISLLFMCLCLFVTGQELLQRVPEKPRTEFPQEEKQETPSIRERLFFGGNFWLSVGSSTNINISPVIGLWVLPRLAVAIGPEYNYIKEYGIPGSASIWGGKTYVQFSVIKDLNKFLPFGANTGIFIHLEDELLNVDASYWNLPADRKNMNTLLGGPGISQQIGRRAFVNFMVLWTLAESDPVLGTYFYSNPEIRIGFAF